MIQTLLKYAHYCELGHLNCSNEERVEKCFYCKRDELGQIVAQCGAKIDRTHALPGYLEFRQVYNKEVFDGIMSGHEMSEFVYSVHKNLVILNETVEQVCKKLGIKSKIGSIK
jgi:hypothetical protein